MALGAPTHRRPTLGRVAAALVLTGLVLTGLGLTACSGSSGAQPTPSSSSGPSSSSPSSTSPASSTSTAPTTSPSPGAADIAAAELGRLSLAAQVGQLFMVAIPASGTSVSALRPGSSRLIGNVMLSGRSTRSTAKIAALVGPARAATTSPDGAVRPFVATDQEGGQVQVLRGPGFTAIPSALTQGTWSPALLQRRATAWGQELRAAGVNLDLAPVADTVPAATASSNGPIGVFDREFGHTPGSIAPHVVAFQAGLAAARVATSVKHFPGLGYVRGNTDTSSHVVDSQTTPTSASLEPFRAAIQAGAPLVMVSTATYARIDAQRPAAFSPAVITTLLRRDLGFTGPVISDDLGAARQVRAWAPGTRAVDFIAAGGDIVLTVDPATVAPMYDAVLARARSSTAFRAQVRAAVVRVLTAKARLGLVRG